MGRVRWALPAARRPHLTPTLSAPEGGEGDFQLSLYCFEHPRNVFHHIPVPKADYAIPVSCDFIGSGLIIFDTQRVLATI